MTGDRNPMTTRRARREEKAGRIHDEGLQAGGKLLTRPNRYYIKLTTNILPRGASGGRKRLQGVSDEARRTRNTCYGGGGHVASGSGRAGGGDTGRRDEGRLKYREGKESRGEEGR